MRTKFYPNDHTNPWMPYRATKSDVWAAATWATVIMQCEGGWIAFESPDDAHSGKYTSKTGNRGDKNVE